MTRRNIVTCFAITPLASALAATTQKLTFDVEVLEDKFGIYPKGTSLFKLRCVGPDGGAQTFFGARFCDAAKKNVAYVVEETWGEVASREIKNLASYAMAAHFYPTQSERQKTYTYTVYTGRSGKFGVT